MVPSSPVIEIMAGLYSDFTCNLNFTQKEKQKENGSINVLSFRKNNEKMYTLFKKSKS